MVGVKGKSGRWTPTERGLCSNRLVCP